MKHHDSEPPAITSLDAFAARMAASAALRRDAAAAILAGRPVPAEIAPDLTLLRDELAETADRDGQAELELAPDQTLRLSLAEETAQLENDALYLDEGREALFKHLARRRHGFRDAVRKGLKAISGHGVNVFLCHCDALFCAPGQRFVTAVQPLWNAVALARFAASRAARSVLWSPAPLGGPGIVDLAVVPPRAFAWAASLGRQTLDAAGTEHDAPLSAEKTALLESINARLAMLLADPSWRAFAYVGSGLQFRRGETVVARQDSLGSVDEDASLELLEHIHDIVDAVDPEREHFRVEDDGLDVIVTPTATNQDVWRDFSPAEGLRAAADALSLDLGRGPHLLCCGGPDGLELLTALVAVADDVRCLFVSDREELGHKARELCPHTAVVPHPDFAAAIFSAGAP